MSRPDPVYVLRGCSQPISALCRPKGRPSLIVGAQDGRVLVWDLTTRRVEFQVPGHSEAVLCVEAEGEEVVTQGRDGHLRMWRMEDGILHPTGDKTYASIGFCPLLVTDNYWCLPFEESPGQLTLVRKDGTPFGKLVVQDSSERKYGMAMITRQRNGDIFVGYEDGSVARWDTNRLTMLSRSKFHDDAIMAMDVSQQSCKGVSASADERLEVWTWDQDDRELKSYKSIKITNPGVNSIRIRRDDKLFVCACWDSTVRVYGMKKLNLLALLSAHKGAVRCLTFDEEDYLYCGSDDGTITVWGIYRS